MRRGRGEHKKAFKDAASQYRKRALVAGGLRCPNGPLLRDLFERLLKNIEIIESVEAKPSDPPSPEGFADVDTTAERAQRELE